MAALLDSIQGTPMSVTNDEEFQAMEIFWIKIIKGLRKLDIKCTYQTESIIQGYIDDFAAETESLQADNEWINSILHGEDVDKDQLDPAIYDRFLLVMEIQERLSVYQSSLKYLRGAREYADQLMELKRAQHESSAATAATAATGTTDSRDSDSAPNAPAQLNPVKMFAPVPTTSSSSASASSSPPKTGFYPGVFLGKLATAAAAITTPNKSTPPPAAESSSSTAPVRARTSSAAAAAQGDKYYPGKYLHKLIKKVQHASPAVSSATRKSHALSMDIEPELDTDELLAYCDDIRLQACALLDADIEDVDVIDAALQNKLLRLRTLNNSDTRANSANSNAKDCCHAGNTASARSSVSEVTSQF